MDEVAKAALGDVTHRVNTRVSRELERTMKPLPTIKQEDEEVEVEEEEVVGVEVEVDTVDEAGEVEVEEEDLSDFDSTFVVVKRLLCFFSFLTDKDTKEADATLTTLTLTSSPTELIIFSFFI